MFPSQRRRKWWTLLSSKKVRALSAVRWELKKKQKKNPSAHHFKAPDRPNTHSCSPNAGGPLVYDSVQLVQNSAALNGTQRVLLDHVISEQECSDLSHLAHVRV